MYSHAELERRTPPVTSRDVLLKGTLIAHINTNTVCHRKIHTIFLHHARPRTLSSSSHFTDLAGSHLSTQLSKNVPLQLCGSSDFLFDQFHSQHPLISFIQRKKRYIPYISFSECIESRLLPFIVVCVRLYVCDHYTKLLCDKF